MKGILILLLIPVLSKGQLPTKDGKVFYETVDTSSVDKELVYNNTKLWLANTFRDSKSVIEIDNKELGQVVGKGNFDFHYTYALTPVSTACFFTMRIDFKQNKYRLQLYNFSIGTYTNQIPLEDYTRHPDRNPSKKILTAIDEKVNLIIKDFKEHVASQADQSF